MDIDYRQLLITGRYRQYALFLSDYPLNDDSPRQLYLLTDEGFIQYRDPKIIFSTEEILIAPDIKLSPGPNGVLCDDVLNGIELFFNRMENFLFDVYTQLEFSDGKYFVHAIYRHNLVSIISSPKTQSDKQLLDWDYQLFRNYLLYENFFRVNDWDPNSAYDVNLNHIITNDRDDLLQIYIDVKNLSFCPSVDLAIETMSVKCIKYMFEHGTLWSANIVEPSIKIPHLTNDYEKDIYDYFQREGISVPVKLFIAFDRADLLDAYLHSDLSNDNKSLSSNDPSISNDSLSSNKLLNSNSFRDEDSSLCNLVRQNKEISRFNDLFEIGPLISTGKILTFRYLLDNNIYLHYRNYEIIPGRKGEADDLSDLCNKAKIDDAIKQEMLKMIKDAQERDRKRNPYLRMLEAILFEDDDWLSARIETILTDQSPSGLNDKFIDPNDKFIDLNDKFIDLNDKFIDLNDKFIDLNDKFIDLNDKFMDLSQKFIPRNLIEHRLCDETNYSPEGKERIDFLTYILRGQDLEVFEVIFEKLKYPIDINESHLEIAFGSSDFYSTDRSLAFNPQHRRFGRQGYHNGNQILKLKAPYLLSIEYQKTIFRRMNHLFADQGSYVSILVKDILYLISLFMIIIPEDPSNEVSEL